MRVSYEWLKSMVDVPMRVSYEWLKSMVDVPADPAELVAEFTRTGTEVEAVEKVGANLEHVVTAQVVSKKPHPDSDHMWLCQVSVGDKNVDESGNPVPLQIVCGAQNFNEGDHIVTAMIGAVLPGDFKIKKSKLRGVESCGMNCSARELGLGSDHEGIMILPEDAPVGMDFTDYLGMSDTVIDCEITPNRPDCLSMTGMAVEVAAILDEDTHIELPAVKAEQGPNAADLVDVTIDDPELCPRYTARVVRNVKIGPSPEWLAQRVAAAGGRSINNVVDVTNYVMYLTGQPLHAFDLGKLTERDGRRHIVVRAAHDGEKLVTLDGQERELTHDMCLITDDGRTPIALAGVMGGLDSEITEGTTDVLLESANFSSGHTSRTSRNLDLMSEASIRYERKVDGSNCANVAEIAAALFEECCGAEVCPGIVDVYPGEADDAPVQIALRPSRARLIGGADIPKAERGYRYSFTVTMILMVGIAAVLFVFADWMIIPFTYSESMVEYRPVFAHVLRIYALLIPFIGMIDIGSSILQSLRLAQVSMFSSFARNILIVVMLFFASSVSLDAIYWSLVVAEVIGGALMLWLAKVGLKHYRRGRERPRAA